MATRGPRQGMLFAPARDLPADLQVELRRFDDFGTGTATTVTRTERDARRSEVSGRHETIQRDRARQAVVELSKRVRWKRFLKESNTSPDTTGAWMARSSRTR